jgi:basic membrane lipoprotein Med (substrate-binding protein (PBP1-ABC) superfamily)
MKRKKTNKKGVQLMRKRIAVILCALCVTLAFVGCGKKQKEEKTTETNVTTTTEQTTIEETTEQETFRYSVKYEAVIDTSDLTDQETSDMISNLRNIAQENNMQIGLGQARYQELVLEITCFYNDESVTVNEVREKLLSGLTIKSIQ